jgi:hypothetical protein
VGLAVLICLVLASGAALVITDRARKEHKPARKDGPALNSVLAPPQRKSPQKIFLAAQSPATTLTSNAPIPRTPHIAVPTHSVSAKPILAASRSPKTAQIRLPSAMLLHPPTPLSRHGFGLLTVVFLVVVIPISLARLRR